MLVTRQYRPTFDTHTHTHTHTLTTDSHVKQSRGVDTWQSRSHVKWLPTSWHLTSYGVLMKRPFWAQPPYHCRTCRVPILRCLRSAYLNQRSGIWCRLLYWCLITVRLYCNWTTIIIIVVGCRKSTEHSPHAALWRHELSTAFNFKGLRHLIFIPIGSL